MWKVIRDLCIYSVVMLRKLRAIAMDGPMRNRHLMMVGHVDVIWEKGELSLAYRS
jgi:hypothetical protein